MEAASPTRELSGEKAQRIVDAMRASVGLRGTTDSTFDHVAREAGVSRGLLHYGRCAKLDAFIRRRRRLVPAAAARARAAARGLRVGPQTTAG